MIPQILPPDALDQITGVFLPLVAANILPILGILAFALGVKIVTLYTNGALTGQFGQADLKWYDVKTRYNRSKSDW